MHMLQAVTVICVYVWLTQDYTNKMAPIVNYTLCSGGSDARKCILQVHVIAISAMSTME